LYQPVRTKQCINIVKKVVEIVPVWLQREQQPWNPRDNSRLW
jgi:hypothetical protein